MLAATLPGLESANIFASSIICFNDISKPASSWGTKNLDMLSFIFCSPLSSHEGSNWRDSHCSLQYSPRYLPCCPRCPWRGPAPPCRSPEQLRPNRATPEFGLVVTHNDIVHKSHGFWKVIYGYLLISVCCRLEGHSLKFRIHFASALKTKGGIINPSCHSQFYPQQTTLISHRS